MKISDEAEYWYRKGLRCMTRRRWNRYVLAIECFKRANKIRPDMRTYRKLFQCYIRNNSLEFAAGLDSYLYERGMCELRAGNTESAVQYFEESNQYAPHAKTYERLYQCHIEQGDSGKAFDCIFRAYMKSGNNDKIAYEYAQMLAAHRRNYVKAKRVLSGILARNSTYKPAKILLEEINAACNAASNDLK